LVTSLFNFTYNYYNFFLFQDVLSKTWSLYSFYALLAVIDQLNSFSELHATPNKFENAVLFLGLGLSSKQSFLKTLLTETTFESERKTSLKTELFESEFPVRIFFKNKSKITGYCSFSNFFCSARRITSEVRKRLSTGQYSSASCTQCL